MNPITEYYAFAWILGLLIGFVVAISWKGLLIAIPLCAFFYGSYLGLKSYNNIRKILPEEANASLLITQSFYWTVKAFLCFSICAPIAFLIKKSF